MKRDRIMQADDMFIEGLKQLFSVRTGEFIGYHNDHKDIPDEQQQQIEETNPNQLTLEI